MLYRQLPHSPAIFAASSTTTLRLVIPVSLTGTHILLWTKFTYINFGHHLTAMINHSSSFILYHLYTRREKECREWTKIKVEEEQPTRRKLLSAKLLHTRIYHILPRKKNRTTISTIHHLHLWLCIIYRSHFITEGFFFSMYLSLFLSS